MVVKGTIFVKNAEGQVGTSADVIVSNRLAYTPKVSVIIPVHDAERYLRECLDSVVGQTLKEIEIICVDDGSTDSSREILNEYAAKDERITIIAQPNTNAGVARNAGLTVARGEYVGFVDSDDYVSAGMYAELFRKAHTEQIDVCICQYQFFDTQTNKVIGAWGINKNALKLFFQGEADVLHIHPGDPIFQLTNHAPWNKIYNREFLRRNAIYFQSILSSNDVAFTNTALACAQTVGLMTEKLYHYRTNTASSLTDNKKTNLCSFYEAIKELHARLIKRGRYMRYRQSFINAVIGTCIYNYEKVDKQSKKKLKKLFFQEVFPKYGISTNALPLIYFEHYRSKLIELLSPPSLRTCLRRFFFHSKRTENYTKYYLLGLQVYKRKVEEVMTRSTEESTIPKVSVVIPIYNASLFLRECLDSILSQSLREIEVICVNDGSTDNSLDIIKEYAAEDSRVRYIDKPNAGYGQTMNCGMRQATGEYIGIVEPDDFIDLRMYETLYNKAKELDLDMIRSGIIFYWKDRPCRKITLLKKSSLCNRLLCPRKDKASLQATMNNVTGIYKTSFIRSNKIDFNETPGASFQDNGFWVKTNFLAQRAYLLNDHFYYYRQDNENSSVNSKEKAFCIFQEYSLIEKYLENIPEIKNELIYEYNYKKIKSYIFHHQRIAAKYKKEFLRKFRKEFFEARNRGEIDLSIMAPYFKKQVSYLFHLKKQNKLRAYLFFPIYLWKRTKLRKKLQERHVM